MWTICSFVGKVNILGCGLVGIIRFFVCLFLGPISKIGLAFYAVCILTKAQISKANFFLVIFCL